MDITEKAMLIRLSISQWTARKYDKTATQEVIEKHHANKDAGRFNKVLVDLAEIKALQQIATAARNKHYAMTLPWAAGVDILPSELYLKYTEAMAKFRADFDERLERFLALYPSLIERAKAELNGLFNAADYPSIDEIRSRYNFDIDIQPVPRAGDFRVAMSQADAEAIRIDIEARINARIGDAVKDAFHRLFTIAQKIAATCRVEDKRFHDTLIGNLRELLDVLPSLNLTGDEALTKAIGEARRLAEVEPDTLREDKDVRAQTAARADRLAKKLKGFAF